MNNDVFSPGPTADSVKSADGAIHTVPQGWALLPPGDAGLTRRVKAAGEFWSVQEKKGRRTFSKGIWAPADTIERLRADLEAERATPAYAKKQAAAAARRAEEQANYVEDFAGTVRDYLNFHPVHAEVAERITVAVTAHATPVGSGTVARTKRIPLERRAEAAVIAWMRHQTTAYDEMVIPRVKGKRREVRRMLAQRSKELLNHYRSSALPPEDCPLQCALALAEENTLE